MRLVDEISAAVGGEFDRMTLGAAASLAKSLARAECFELSADIALAIANVRALRPSSIVSALPFSRPPFPTTWVEWVCAEVAPTLEGRDPPTFNKPMPRRMGALIEDVGVDGVAGVTWAWSHPEFGLNICPISAFQSWVPGALNRLAGIAAQMAHSIGDALRIADHYKAISVQDAKTIAQGAPAWKACRDNPVELNAIVELSKWEAITASPHCRKMVDMFRRRATPEQFRSAEQSWSEDLQGEPAFLRAFLILLNTKNGAVTERENLSRLNGARQKSGKPKLREFQITRLALSRHASRSAVSLGATREQIRQHYVRGHFKVRKSGVFWWSPFVRGNPTEAIPRERYAVVSGLRPENASK